MEHEHEHTHTYTHSHPHSHDRDHTHEHEHEHPHEQMHDHAHEHHHAGAVEPPERVQVLLAYMIDHNDHHAAELVRLLDSLEGDAREKLLASVALFEQANDLLRETLQLAQQ